MAQACIASTTSLALSQDGIGTLRGNVNVDPHPWNSVKSGAAGLVNQPTVGAYGYPFAGDDTYATAIALQPVQGFVAFGPELQAATQSPVAGAIVTALVSWEIQSNYGGGANNPFSGISYALQYSYDHANWGTFAESAQASASGQTFLWHVTATWPIAWGDTAAHNVWFRMLVAAGNFGAGEAITVNFTRRRSAYMLY